MSDGFTSQFQKICATESLINFVETTDVRILHSPLRSQHLGPVLELNRPTFWSKLGRNLFEIFCKRFHATRERADTVDILEYGLQGPNFFSSAKRVSQRFVLSKRPPKALEAQYRTIVQLLFIPLYIVRTMPLLLCP